MNRKQLTTLIVLAVVLGGFGWLAYNKRETSYKESTRRMGEKLFKEFPLNDVSQITIRQAKGELNLVKQDDAWTVKERSNHPANFGTISDFLRKLWELKVTQPVRVPASRLPVLELVPPDKGPGTLVELKDAKGKSLNTLLLGAKHMKESPAGAPFGGGSWPAGRYVMADNDANSIAMVAEPFSNIEPKAEDWLNKDWFKVEKHKLVSVVTTNATNNWKVFRETETGEWKLADLKAGESLDSGKVSSVNNALGFPSFNDLATNPAPAATGMDKPAITATIETFDGFTYTAKVGNKTGEDNYYFQVTVAGTFPKERVAGKDEKPEDKEKLDKEFKEKIKKFEDKLKTEKAFEKWSYVVSKWTVDALFKERKDLLAEKKEEPKKDEAKPDAAVPPSVPPVPPRVESKPVEVKVDAAKPVKVEGKPADPKTEQSKPITAVPPVPPPLPTPERAVKPTVPDVPARVESKPVEIKLDPVKPAEPAKVEVKPVAPKPAEVKKDEPKPAEKK
jgi:hypothetical protein